MARKSSHFWPYKIFFFNTMLSMEKVCVLNLCFFFFFQGENSRTLAVTYFLFSFC